MTATAGVFLENEFCSLQILGNSRGVRFNRLGGISSDGLTAFGVAGKEVPPVVGFVWRGGGITQFPAAEGYGAFLARNINKNGSVLVGELISQDSDGVSVAAYLSDGQYHILPTPAEATRNCANVISDDGRVVVGHYGRDVWFNTRFRPQYYACMWVDGHPYSLGLWLHDGNGYSKALDVSADGSVIVGYGCESIEPSLYYLSMTAFRWKDGQIQWLGEGMAGSVSADGSKVLCVTSSLDAPRSSYVWENGEITILGSLPGLDGVMGTMISRDGSAVIGECFNQDRSEVVLWHLNEPDRPISLNSYVDALGLPAEVFDIAGASGISEDLCTIVGSGGPNGGRPFCGYILRLKEPPR